MKKVKFEQKLGLRKETVAGLNSETMEDVKGGIVPAYTDVYECSTRVSVCGSCETYVYTCRPSNGKVF